MSAAHDYRSALLRVIQRPVPSGRLIQQLRANLGELEFVALEEGCGEFRCATDGLSFRVHEHLDSRFLLQILSADFSLRVPRREGCEGQILVQHTGALRRRGVAFQLAPRSPAACEPLRRRLQADDRLTAALMPLDFTHCRIIAQHDALELRLRHFAASEVVGQLPRFRRYVPLHAAQRDALLATLRAFRELKSD